MGLSVLSKSNFGLRYLSRYLHQILRAHTTATVYYVYYSDLEMTFNFILTLKIPDLEDQHVSAFQ